MVCFSSAIIIDFSTTIPMPEGGSSSIFKKKHKKYSHSQSQTSPPVTQTIRPKWLRYSLASIFFKFFSKYSQKLKVLTTTPQFPTVSDSKKIFGHCAKKILVASFPGTFIIFAANRVGGVSLQICKRAKLN